MAENQEYLEIGTEKCIGIREFTGHVFHGIVLGPHNEQQPFNPDYRYDQLFRTRNDKNVRDTHSITVGGFTLGHGLYTTPVKSHAQDYATLDQYRTIGEPKIGKPSLMTLQIEQARLYDFRDPQNLNEEGVVPESLAQKWLLFYRSNQQELKDYMKDQPIGVQSVRAYEIETYSAFLENFLARYHGEPNPDPTQLPRSPLWPSSASNILGIGDHPRNLSIHDMLRTLAGDIVFTHPSHGGLWAEFVQKELHCDGIIGVEGGDREGMSIEPSYVFYNLDTIKGISTEAVSS